MTEPLLPRVARNEPDAVRECLARYEGLIWSLARRFCRNHADAEDAVQSIFVELWRSASRFDPSLGSEVTFVSVIARRELIDCNRSMRRRRGAFSIQERHEAPARTLPPAVERSEEAGRAAHSVSCLGRNEQLVITLAVDRGLSHQRIATVTGFPVGTVKTHVRRSLMKLRGMLATTEVDSRESRREPTPSAGAETALGRQR